MMVSLDMILQVFVLGSQRLELFLHMISIFFQLVKLTAFQLDKLEVVGCEFVLGRRKRFILMWLIVIIVP
jgi:hypothetical protein